jgi:DNA-binding GntR family transcriptional regulator
MWTVVYLSSRSQCDLIPPEASLQPRRTATIPDVSTISGGYRVGPASGHDVNIGSPPATGLLTVEDLHSIFRLLRTIRVDLARRSAPLLRPADFDRLGSHLDLITTTKIMPNQAAAAHRVFVGGLLSPGATNPELHAVAMLSRQVGAHLDYAMNRLGVHPAEFPGQVEVHTLLFDTLRQADQEGAAAAAAQMTDAGQRAAIMLAHQLDT